MNRPPHERPEENPYAAPLSSIERPRVASSSTAPASTSPAFKQSKPGPANSIGAGTLLGGILAIVLLIESQPLGYVLPLIGSVLGGLAYRVRSRDWPVDPTARKRQFAYAFALVTLIPVVVFLQVGIRGQGPGIVLVGAFVGLSLAIGIFVAGVRRHGVLLESAQMSDED